MNHKINYLQIEPTTRCNYDCSFCTGRHLVQKDMDLYTFKKIISSLPSSLALIKLQGEGEPFLNHDLFTMIKYARECHPNVEICLASNGSLFNAKNIEEIIEARILKILVSIESAKDEIYNELRKGGNLTKVKNGIKALQKAKINKNAKFPEIGFAFTILREYMNDYLEIFDLYDELGLNGGFDFQILLNLDVYTRYYDDYLKEQFIQKSEYLQLCNIATQNPKVFNILNKPKKSSEVFQRVFSLPPDFKGCGWLEHRLYVNVEGIASGCCFIKEGNRYGFGSLVENDLNHILEKRYEMQMQLLSGKIPDACIGCWTAESIILNK